MDVDDFIRIIFLLMLIGLPLIRFIFKKLFQVTQRANEFARRVEREHRESQSRELSADGIDEDRWEHVEDPEEDFALEEAPEPVQVEPARPTRRPRSRKRPSLEVQRFLEELTGVRPQPAPVPTVVPAPPRPAPPPVAPEPTTSSLVTDSVSAWDSPSTSGSSSRRRSSGRRPGRRQLQQYVLWSEVLGKPVALREPKKESWEA